MRSTLLLQCLLCIILLFTSITLYSRQSTRAAAAGTFAEHFISNDSFEDLSRNLMGELCQ